MSRQLKEKAAPDRNWLGRVQIIDSLENFQDLIVISLCVGLFSTMVLKLWAVFVSLLHPVNFQAISSEILFILILVELFRLLIIYLREHRISVSVAVEVAIVSVLREVIVKGVLEIPSAQITSTCLFLLVLGSLLLIRAGMARLMHVSGPEPQKQLHSGEHKDGLASTLSLAHIEDYGSLAALKDP
ncbi:phosphate-starvation-inducible PsiE family protein [Leptolyngbya sp. FACHB-261]|uniref:phosphate-starvation-inducible PsiE family protein n=1 Tax=Leptolyngbya sp. FACHB-261 TaxID=2692806 RepID=UPI001689CDCE|nr:phosphate-starvation-inducible PsiE family protein [Leptolyngbya sp. FACHB-261]MBD2099980.1 phosphate-starvation-inducible PsiE family protein [Leptolyngbya sp. FACHB-261]